MTARKPARPRATEKRPRPPSVDDQALELVERSMVAIRRSMSRRTLGKRLLEEMGGDDLAALGVVDVVELGRQGEGEITVGRVATELGLDPSRASRLVTAAIDAGYVKREASQEDGRRITLVLTPAGDTLLEHAHRIRQDVFRTAMRDWTSAERQEFARLLWRFIGNVGPAAAEGRTG
ncbi:MAG: winged helix-turn-helix transcriptional regulator [Cytophagaceae bacterium]|nr:winged helix-turn-helix transcriptional regulator [Gemmatimonadaceae bacterium]